jgi:hypothetical protein
MKNEIEFHIDTARSTENKVEIFQEQLKKYKVTKNEVAAQTSFIIQNDSQSRETFKN